MGEETPRRFLARRSSWSRCELTNRTPELSMMTLDAPPLGAATGHGPLEQSHVLPSFRQNKCIYMKNGHRTCSAFNALNICKYLLTLSYGIKGPALQTIFSFEAARGHVSQLDPSSTPETLQDSHTHTHSRSSNWTTYFPDLVPLQPLQRTTTGDGPFPVILILDLPFPAVAPRDSGIGVEHRHPSVAVPSCNSWLCLCQTESQDNFCSPPNTAILPRLVLINSKKGRRRVGVTTPVAPTMQRSNSFRLGTPLTSSSNLEVGPPALRCNPQTPGT